MNNQEVEYLKTIFIARLGSFLQGHLKVDKDKTWDIGAPDKRLRHIYADEVTATKVNGETSGGGTGGGAADTAKFLKGKDGSSYANLTWYASPDMTPNTIPVLDGQGSLPKGAYSEALLIDGSRNLEGAGIWTIAMDVAVSESKRIDNLHIGRHDHSGVDGLGTKVDHWLLLNNDANVHPQYTQRGVDELITGAWAFTNEFEIIRDPYTGNEISRTPTVGWQFLPDLKRLTSVPYDRIVFSAEADKAQMWMGQNQEILANVTETEVSWKIGLGEDTIKMSGSDPTYRFWVGADDPADAEFSIDKTGFFRATSGNIAGWLVTPSRIEEGGEMIPGFIEGGNMKLYATGVIRIGDEVEGHLDQVVLSSQDPEWRIWAGNNNSEDAPFKVSRWGQVHLGDASVTGVLQSANFVQGYSGFRLESNGAAEFNSIVARGRIETAVFSESKISAVSGMVIIAEAASVKEPITGGSNPDTTIILDSPIFSGDDILYVKSVDTVELPDGGYESTVYDEYMRVIGSPTAEAEDRWVYAVVRDLAGTGAVDLKVADTLVRQGSAKSNVPSGAIGGDAMYPFGSGVKGSEFGTQVPGGSVSEVEGGWLILEGSRGKGPYFGVARREGPIYNQFKQVVRIGNLKGALAKYTKIDYGAFVGDEQRYWSYDMTNGLEIRTREGSTNIDDFGIRSDEFTLKLMTLTDVTKSDTRVGLDLGYMPEGARFFFVDDGKPRVGIKMRSGVNADITIDRIGDMSVDVWAKNGGAAQYKVDKALVADSANAVTWGNVSGKPNFDALYSAIDHTHAWSEITADDEVYQRSWFIGY